MPVSISESEPSNHKINEAAALHRPPVHWGSCSSTPRISHPSAMATSGPLLDFGQPYLIIPWTTDHGLHVVINAVRGHCLLVRDKISADRDVYGDTFPEPVSLREGEQFSSVDDRVQTSS
ncbi:hypothetical protein J6590_101090 [Homalodisca vitripennis]|nr:hypothetical protein J6590_101090 [Homalodisca vitripennis]